MRGGGFSTPPSQRTVTSPPAKQTVPDDCTGAGQGGEGRRRGAESKRVREGAWVEGGGGGGGRGKGEGERKGTCTGAKSEGRLTEAESPGSGSGDDIASVRPRPTPLPRSVRARELCGYVHMRVCAKKKKRERDRERQRQRETETERDRDRETEAERESLAHVGDDVGHVEGVRTVDQSPDSQYLSRPPARAGMQSICAGAPFETVPLFPFLSLYLSISPPLPSPSIYRSICLSVCSSVCLFLSFSLQSTPLSFVSLPFSLSPSLSLSISPCLTVSGVRAYTHVYIFSAPHGESRGRNYLRSSGRSPRMVCTPRPASGGGGGGAGGGGHGVE